MIIMEHLKRTRAALLEFHRELEALQGVLPVMRIPNDPTHPAYKAHKFMEGLGIGKVQRALDTLLEEKERQGY